MNMPFFLSTWSTTSRTYSFITHSYLTLIAPANVDTFVIAPSRVASPCCIYDRGKLGLVVCLPFFFCWALLSIYHYCHFCQSRQPLTVHNAYQATYVLTAEAQAMWCTWILQWRWCTWKPYAGCTMRILYCWWPCVRTHGGFSALYRGLPPYFHLCPSRSCAVWDCILIHVLKLSCTWVLHHRSLGLQMVELMGVRY